MKLLDIATEAWRNVRAGAVRPFVTVVVTTFITLTLALLDMTQVAEVVRQAEEYRAAGAATYHVLADGFVDGRRCQALASVDGVEQAGAVRATEAPFAPTAMPRSPVPVYEATPGIAAMLGEELADSILLDANTAGQLGVAAGDTLAGVSGSLPIGAVYDYPDDGRDQRLSYAVVRIGEPAALAATALAMLAAARLRRLELSFARHLGLRRVEAGALLLAESLCAAGVLLAVVGAASVGTAYLSGYSAVLSFGIRIAAAGAAGCLLGGFLGGLLTSERRVQAYFKSR